MTEKKPSPEKQKNNRKNKTRAEEKEINGYAAQGLLEPTRYNDWEVKGRCSDF